MSQWKKITIRVMRYVTLLLIVGFVALLLIYTSGSNRPFEKVEKSVEASLDKENMKRQDGTPSMNISKRSISNTSLFR